MKNIAARSVHQNFAPRLKALMHTLAHAGIISAATFMATAVPASAFSDRVQSSCTSDYISFCSRHDPDSPALRYCMESNRNKLSQQCINALVDAGEVPRKYLNKQNRTN